MRISAAELRRFDAENAQLRADLEAEQRINGMGAERELALMAKFEAAERENAKLLAELEAMARAIDEEKIVSHIGVFNRGDDPVKAIKELMLWSEGVGEYFANEKAKEKIAALEAELEAIYSTEPVAWQISVPDEPELGTWICENEVGAGFNTIPLIPLPVRKS